MASGTHRQDMDIDTDLVDEMESRIEAAFQQTGSSGVRVEGSSGPQDLRVSHWRQGVYEVDRKEKERLQKVHDAQAERRRRQEEDVRMWLAARTGNPKAAGKENVDAYDLGKGPSRLKKGLPRRKPHIPKEMVIYDGLQLNLLTQFDLTASGIFSPSTLLEFIGRTVVIGEKSEEVLIPDDHLGYHLWVAVNKSLSDPLLMDSFQSILHQNDDHRRSLLLECVFEQLIVELATANADRLHTTPHNPKEIHLFVDPRKNDDVKATVRSARRIVALFRHQHENGRESFNDEVEIYVSIAATEKGIIASRELEKTGIKTNLTQVSSVEHALACTSHAGASCVTINVARAAEITLLAGELDGVVLNKTATESVRIIAGPDPISNINASTRLPGAHADAAASLLVSSSADNENYDDGDVRQDCQSLDLMRTLSAESRSVFIGTMFPMLGAWKVCMDRAQKMVYRELETQYHTKIFDLKALCSSWKAQPEKAVTQADDGGRSVDIHQPKVREDKLTFRGSSTQGVAASPSPLGPGGDAFPREDDLDLFAVEMREAGSEKEREERETAIIDNIIRNVLEEEECF
ncbi:hypothetical protein V5O48_014601 [Marasmius crinis-equi]|uniref:Uncharacterized protein n=1 Tax=Marasmius crinis-equi TaxID=585013 RepID=A0ABR3EWW3_9AGAR